VPLEREKAGSYAKLLEVLLELHLLSPVLLFKEREQRKRGDPL